MTQQQRSYARTFEKFADIPSGTIVEPTLTQMLAAFSLKRHGAEVMADRPVGSEAFASCLRDDVAEANRSRRNKRV
ncbi:MAG: hypothetical protein KF796_14105 [Ramlibacter sp.]|nr:hypothetical protein [Ramlibacter sp.]